MQTNIKINKYKNKKTNGFINIKKLEENNLFILYINKRPYELIKNSLNYLLLDDFFKNYEDNLKGYRFNLFFNGGGIGSISKGITILLLRFIELNNKIKLFKNIHKNIVKNKYKKHFNRKGAKAKYRKSYR